MKVVVSLRKVENCPDSRKNALNPWFVEMWQSSFDRSLITGRSVHLVSKEIFYWQGI